MPTKPKPLFAPKLYELPTKERIPYLVHIIWDLQAERDKLQDENTRLKMASLQSFINDAYAKGIDHGMAISNANEEELSP